MKCPRCRQECDASQTRCPACGTRQPAAEGVFSTSIVRISTRRADRVYRSVNDVPAKLRTRLQRSTVSGNSGTILIADRAGRRQIAKALEAFPEAARSGGGRAPARARRRRKAILLGALGLLLALIALLAFWLA